MQLGNMKGNLNEGLRLYSRIQSKSCELFSRVLIHDFKYSIPFRGKGEGEILEIKYVSKPFSDDMTGSL